MSNRLKSAGASVALALLLASSPLAFDRNSGHLHPLAAFAKDGRSGGRSGGSDDHGGSRSTGGSHGSDDAGRASSSGASGSSPGRSRSSDDTGGDRRGGHGRGADDASGGKAVRRAKVEIRGTHIEVTTPDGFKQEIENGRFEVKDPFGRTVIERRATAADRARLLSFAK